jgi:hypothetical protein
MTTSSISEQIISDARIYIQRRTCDLHGLQTFWEELHQMEFDSPPDWPYIFQKLYLAACTHKHKEVAEWLKNIYELNTDPITQIAYRHTFSYGNYLLSKKNNCA